MSRRKGLTLYGFRNTFSILTSVASRTPPSQLRRELRRRSGFRCCFPKCQVPYLSYHHFDPPWEPHHVHNPDGMIALCSTHHGLADGGLYSVERLRSFIRRRE